MENNFPASTTSQSIKQIGKHIFHEGMRQDTFGITVCNNNNNNNNNNDVTVYWDILEYSGHDDEEEDKILRPDGKIIRKGVKKIYVLEMSIPWIENRELKLNEKVEKYKSTVQSMKVDNPLFEVQQLTFIVDCLGGYSKSFPDALKTLEFTKIEIDRICLETQKIVISEATNTINRFKVLTIQWDERTVLICR